MMNPALAAPEPKTESPARPSQTPAPTPAPPLAPAPIRTDTERMYAHLAKRPKPPTLKGAWHRRTMMIAMHAALFVITFGLLPFWLALATIVDLITERTLRPKLGRVRTVLIMLLVFTCELGGVLALGVIIPLLRPFIGRRRYLMATHPVQRTWSAIMSVGMFRLFGMQIHVEGKAAIEKGRFLLLMRHTSYADPAVCMTCVINPYRHITRCVFKSGLIYDPCLDIAAHRVPHIFVKRGTGDATAALEQLRWIGSDIGEREAVVIYPEGTRFTTAKRARAIKKLEELNKPELARRAAKMQRVMPPRTTGVQALIEASKYDVDVVFCAHVGLDEVRTLGSLTSGVILGGDLDVKTWRVAAADIPRDESELERWLFDEWAKVDAFACEIYERRRAG